MSGPRQARGVSNATTVDEDLSIESQQPLRPIRDVDKANTHGDEPVHKGKRYLTEGIAHEHLAYAWPNKKKWFMLSIVAVCQTSMYKYLL